MTDSQNDQLVDQPTAHPAGDREIEQVTRLVTTLLSAWTEPDPARKTTLLDSCCTPDITYANPLSAARGTEAVAELLTAINAQFPGITPRRTSGIDLHHNHGLFTWSMIDDTRRTILTGLDIITLTPDNTRISTVTAFFGETPPVTTTYIYGSSAESR